MKFTTSIAICATMLCVCGDNLSEFAPALVITPPSPVKAVGPVEFTARLTTGTGEITWTVTGRGQLSTRTGPSTIYTPPPGSTTETLIATAGRLKASVMVSSEPATLASKAVPGLTAPVTVQYDSQDIPHIECAVAVDCFAVQGYVQARDRLFSMDFLRHVARSRLAELVGPSGLAQDIQLRTLFITRAGHRIEDDLAIHLDTVTTSRVTAFINGINAYLVELRAAPGNQLPGEYAQLPFPLTPADIEDWTVQDMLAMARLQQFQLSETLTEESAAGQFATVYGQGALRDLGKLNAWLRAAAPATERAHTLSPTGIHAMRAPAGAQRLTVPAGLRQWAPALHLLSARAEVLRGRLQSAGDLGSNNWVVSASKSATRAAMIANDPHLALQYPPLFHLVAMMSRQATDNLDLVGGAFPGIPGILVGCGKHVCWGVTVVGYDVTDLYLEQFLPQASCPGGTGGAPCVAFKGVPVSTGRVPQTYRVRTGPGPSGLVNAAGLPNPPPPAVFIVPHHGPVIQAPDATGRAISVRWTGHEGNTQDTKAVLDLNTALDVDAAVTALQNFAVGAQNFVLADDQGHIAYEAHALVPIRKFTEGTTPLTPWLPLSGLGTAEWGDGVSDCAVAGGIPASCWIADSSLPHGKDPVKGYFFSANADPTFPSVSDDNNPLAHPPYMSFAWDDSSGFRATRVEQMIEAAIAAHGYVSFADMQTIQSDHVSRPGAAFAPFVAASSGAAPELALAKRLLAQWATNGFDCPSGLTGTDPKTSPVDIVTRTSQNSSGCFLFHEFLRVLFNNVFADDLKVAGQNVNNLAAIKAMLFLLELPDGAPGTGFCNDVDIRGQLVVAHTCGAQITTALVQAFTTLSTRVNPSPNNWLWGRVHTARPISPAMFANEEFSSGPFARPGGAFTVDVGNPILSGDSLDFAYSSGSNLRFVALMDPVTPVVRLQLPGPERDGPRSADKADLVGQWARNAYFDFALGNQIRDAVVAVQVFNAQ